MVDLGFWQRFESNFGGDFSGLISFYDNLMHYCFDAFELGFGTLGSENLRSGLLGTVDVDK